MDIRAAAALIAAFLEHDACMAYICDQRIRCYAADAIEVRRAALCYQCMYRIVQVEGRVGSPCMDIRAAAAPIAALLEHHVCMAYICDQRTAAMQQMLLRSGVRPFVISACITSCKLRGGWGAHAWTPGQQLPQ